MLNNNNCVTCRLSLHCSYIVEVLYYCIHFAYCFRFHLKWSTVEMVHPQYSVCEDVGSVSILLRRRGNLDQSVFVGVHVKGLTGEEGQDFTTGRAQQIQFDPGEFSVEVLFFT